MILYYQQVRTYTVLIKNIHYKRIFQKLLLLCSAPRCPNKLEQLHVLLRPSPVHVSLSTTVDLLLKSSLILSSLSTCITLKQTSSTPYIFVDRHSGHDTCDASHVSIQPGWKTCLQQGIIFTVSLPSNSVRQMAQSIGCVACAP